MRVARSVPLVLMLVIIPAGLAAQMTISLSGQGMLIDHRVRAAGILESTAGPAVRANVIAAWSSWIQLEGQLTGGQLKARSITAVDQRVTEAGAQIKITPLPWLGIKSGFTTRAYATTFANQHWTNLFLGGEAQTALLQGAMHAILRAQVMPLVSVTGLARPSLAIGGGTGVRWERGRLAAMLVYDVERYRFQVLNGFARTEQVSSLAVEVMVRSVWK